MKLGAFIYDNKNLLSSVIILDQMKKTRYFSFIFIMIFFLCSVLITPLAQAVENPLSTPNNKIGVHILFTTELEAAAKLVNGNGGDYGYVTIAIQSGDKDIEKWQTFLNRSRELHIIPIIRLATEGNPFNTKVWRTPTDYDIIDFANFLNSLNWPYKNRYIIVYNEVNRGDEWGGGLNPREYAELLSYTVTVFKSKSSDFFIIPAGLDNAAPNQSTLYMNQYNYMREMNAAVPGIFNQVDGLSSHSYPNPGFSQPPTANSTMGINSFQYEQALIKSFGSKDLPVFITETGWSTEVIPDAKAAQYYNTALSGTWSDKSIVALTPFLLQGSGGPFQKFSLLGAEGGTSKQYEAIKNYSKIKGKPTQTKSVLAATSTYDISTKPLKDFSEQEIETSQIAPSDEIKGAFKWLLKI